MSFLNNVKELLEPFIEHDQACNPFPHTCVSDVKYACLWQGKETEAQVFKLFKLIKTAQDRDTKHKLINQFYNTLERKHNDQTIAPDYPKPEKVGRVIDKIVSNGIQQIGMWACGESFSIYPWMIAGSGTKAVLYGDDQADITEIRRINVIAADGFLEPNVDGWTASGGFDRPTVSGLVSEIAMGNTATSATSKIFDRSLLPLDDRIQHEQNQDSFTLSSIYVITSI